MGHINEEAGWIQPAGLVFESGGGLVRRPTANLLFLEDHPVKEELQSFVGVVDAQLLEAVHL